MNTTTLKKANELSKSIDETKDAIASVRQLIDRAKSNQVTGSNFNEASQYNLFVHANRDGSGSEVDLSGYHNNMIVLEAVEQVLITRLQKYSEMFLDL